MIQPNLRAIIIDDERHCIETLRYELTAHVPEIELLKTHQDTLDGIKSINDLKPDIVFLDIELNDISGFQFLDHLSYLDFHLIFTTAYDQYAIEALRVKAFDYLMKPVSGAHLRTCIDRLIAEMNEKDADALSQANSESLNKLALPVGSSSIFVDPEGILKVQADGNFSVLTMSTGQEYYISKSLKEMERLLQAPPFIRVHKSHIVNVKEISAYHKADGGKIEMSDQSKMSITLVSIDDIIKYME